MPSCVADVPSCVVPSCVADVLTVAQICGRFTASKKWHSHARGKFCTRPAASYAGDVATDFTRSTCSLREFCSLRVFVARFFFHQIKLSEAGVASTNIARVKRANFIQLVREHLSNPAWCPSNCSDLGN